MNYDIRVKTSFSLILAGSSGSGMRTWLEQFLSLFDKITDGKGKYQKLLQFSGNNQPGLYERIKSTFQGTTIVFDSIDNEIYSKIEEELMHEISANADIGKLFTKGRSHLTCNVILLLQNVFPQGPEMRNLSVNAQYIVIF